MDKVKLWHFYITSSKVIWPKIFFKLHTEVKKCHSDNFSDWAGMAVHYWCGPQESLTGFQKIFLHLVPIKFLAMLEGKLRVTPFLIVQSGKIIVCKD